MSANEPFDSLTRFPEIERLVSKIYFRFSHLFLVQPEAERLLVGDRWLKRRSSTPVSYTHAGLDPTIKHDKTDELVSLELSFQVLKSANPHFPWNRKRGCPFRRILRAGIVFALVATRENFSG